MQVMPMIRFNSYLKEDTHNGIDIGTWEFDGPKEFTMKLMDKFGQPDYIEKNPGTNETYSVTFMDIDGFDLVRIVDSNTNKLHPYPAKIYVEGYLYFKVPTEMVGKLKQASATIMIDELNGYVVGKCASLTICAATIQFVIDAVNGDAPHTREEYDKRLKRIIDDKKTDPEIPWWENKLNEGKTAELIKKSQAKRGAPGTMKRKVKGKMTIAKARALKSRPGATTSDKRQANFFINMHSESLKDWFGKGPKGDWVRVDTKGKIKGDCAREPGEGKPKCMPRSKAHSMSKKDRGSAARRKRAADPQVDRPGTGNKPINVRTESVEYIEEKSKPNNPKLWSRAKSLARSKFDVYPSAYANGWAAKWYKSKGGTWRGSTSESTLVPFLEKCWDGYRQAGMKKKGAKMVPNCVPEENIDEIAPLVGMVARAVAGKAAKMAAGAAVSTAANYAAKKSAERQKVDEDDMKGMSVGSGHKRSVKQGAGMTKKGVAAYRRRNPGSKLGTAVTTPPSKLKAGSKAAGRRKSFCARSRSWTGPRGKAARRRWNC